MTMKRIAITSNYNSEMYDEQWLNVPLMEEGLAQSICNKLNEINPEGPYYYQPKDLNYQLYKFEP